LKYVDGIAVHWYTDRWFPLPDALDTVHEEYPDKFILYTEACTGEISLD
jgi:glucosylceramidase